MVEGIFVASRCKVPWLRSSRWYDKQSPLPSLFSTSSNGLKLHPFWDNQINQTESPHRRIEPVWNPFLQMRIKVQILSGETFTRFLMSTFAWIRLHVNPQRWKRGLSTGTPCHLRPLLLFPYLVMFSLHRHVPLEHNTTTERYSMILPHWYLSKIRALLVVPWALRLEFWFRILGCSRLWIPPAIINVLCSVPLLLSATDGTSLCHGGDSCYILPAILNGLHQEHTWVYLTRKRTVYANSTYALGLVTLSIWVSRTLAISYRKYAILTTRGIYRHCFEAMLCVSIPSLSATHEMDVVFHRRRDTRYDAQGRFKKLFDVQDWKTVGDVAHLAVPHPHMYSTDHNWR